MFSHSLKDAVILGLAFLASGTLGAPVNVTGEAAWGRRAVSDPCSTEIARTGVNIAAAASGCFDALSAHIFTGGRAGVLSSASGAHLASGVLSSAPEKAGRIDQQTLIMNAAVTGATKTLWLDEGLISLITSAEAAQKAQQAAQANVAAAEAALAKAPKNLPAAKLKILQNAVTKAKAAVKPLSQVQTVMLNTVKPAVPNTTLLYTKVGIKAMCVDAMKRSIAANKNLLKGGDFIVGAPNLNGAGVKIRLLEGKDRLTNKGRLNSCFPS